MRQSTTTTTPPPPLPLSCDTFVAFPPATPAGLVVFGKNSDRPVGEGQSITRYYYDPTTVTTTTAKSRGDDSDNNNNDNNNDVVKCTYISIPQVQNNNKIHAVLLSQIDWMWGAEMGANDCGVVIGNEAV